MIRLKVYYAYELFDVLEQQGLAYDDQIQNILREFDFTKIYAYMLITDWKYHFGGPYSSTNYWAIKKSSL